VTEAGKPMGELERIQQEDEIAYSKLDPKVKCAVRAAYRLGVIDGEKKTCRHCESKLAALMQTTNSELWESLGDLDDEHPKLGIVLSFREARTILKSLWKSKSNPTYAQLLHKRLAAKEKNLPNLLEVLERGWPERFKAAVKPARKKKK